MSINYGKQHNEQWKDDDIVCQLNFGRNSNLSQVIVTESAETLVLKFRWAAMSYVELSASNARVLWNWQEILKITPNDTTMHT